MHRVGGGGVGGRGRSRGEWGTPLKIFERVESVEKGSFFQVLNSVCINRFGDCFHTNLPTTRVRINHEM